MPSHEGYRVQGGPLEAHQPSAVIPTGSSLSLIPTGSSLSLSRHSYRLEPKSQPGGTAYAHAPHAPMLVHLCEGIWRQCSREQACTPVPLYPGGMRSRATPF